MLILCKIQQQLAYIFAKIFVFCVLSAPLLETHLMMQGY